eukprot:1156393-Pelagomonas_calceolata.AAC.1
MNELVASFQQLKERRKETEIGSRKGKKWTFMSIENGDRVIPIKKGEDENEKATRTAKNSYSLARGTAVTAATIQVYMGNKCITQKRP